MQSEDGVVIVSEGQFACFYLFIGVLWSRDGSDEGKIVLTEFPDDLPAAD